MSFIKLFFRQLSSSKILSSFLIIVVLAPAIFLAIPAKKADAFLGLGDVVIDPTNLIQNTLTAAATPVSAVNSVFFNLKTFLLDGIATALARGIVQQLTAQTVNWINSGFNGNPAYVTDPQQFFTNIGDQTVINALGTSAGSVGGTILKNICSPFQPQIRLALVQQYLNQNQVQQCSIQNSIKNYEAFTQNFENGGWEGWFSVTQNMQNNPYGAYIQAQDSLNIQIANQNQIYQKQLDQSGGFLNFQKCTGGQVAQIDLSNPNALGATQSDAQICTTVTPGSVIRDQLGKSLGSTWDQLNLTNSINQLVSALMVQGIKGIFGGIEGGLRGLSQSGQSNNASLVSQLMAGSPASDAEAASTTASIYSNVPPSLLGDVGTSTNGFLPSIDEDAVRNQINQQAAAYQAQANQQSGDTGGTCVYTNALAQQITTTTFTQAQCASQSSATWTPNTPVQTPNSTGGISSTDVNVCTATSTSQALNITGLQGYSAATQTYTSAVYANNYLVVYGSGFNPACDTVSVGNGSSNATYTPTYVSSTQLNVLLGPATGSMSVTVSSAAGQSNSQLTTVQ